MLHDFEICQPGTGARLKEVEAELAQCLDCCKRVGKLEAERDAALFQLSAALLQLSECQDS